MIVPAAFCAWRFIPESPVRVPGRINWLAGGADERRDLRGPPVAISETTAWGWGSPKTLGLLAAGLVVCAIWVVVEARSDASR